MSMHPRHPTTGLVAYGARQPFDMVCTSAPALHSTLTVASESSLTGAPSGSRTMQASCPSCRTASVSPGAGSCGTGGPAAGSCGTRSPAAVFSRVNVETLEVCSYWKR